VQARGECSGGMSGHDDDSGTPRKKLWRIAQGLVALSIVVGVFAAVIPNIADYADVWQTLRRLGSLQLVWLVAASLVNLVTYWFQSVAAMPGLTVRMAAIETQTMTTIANTLPGGGAIAVGVGFAMFRSWGYSEGEIARFTLVTGIWNTYIKLGLPALTIGLLVLEGHSNPGLVTGAIIGAATLIVSITILALVLWKPRFARAIGDRLGTAASFVLRPFGKGPVRGWGEAAARFREDTIDLLRRRWVALTATTILSHLSLFLVLLASLRAVGVSQGEVTWIEALAVFALGRLVTALPITPGGVGMIELSYIGGLVWAGGPRTSVVAATLLFRALTYALQIPIGAITYPIWQRTKDRWHRTDDGAVNGGSVRSGSSRPERAGTAAS
jgi:putative heme transporter